MEGLKQWHGGKVVELWNSFQNHTLLTATKNGVEWGEMGGREVNYKEISSLKEQK